MKRLFVELLGAVALVCIAHPSNAARIELFEAWLSIDGATYQFAPSQDTLPGTVNMAGFDLGTGLGAITIASSGTGNHRVGLFLDHDIVDGLLNSYDNESGVTLGPPASGLSWEIDEPGYRFGDIFDNFNAGALDNTNSVPATAPNDVSMAMFWDFTLAAGESATVSFAVSDALQQGVFTLAQTDETAQDITIYLTSTLEGGTPTVTPVPEPGTLLLAGAGLLCLALYGAGKGRQ